MHLRVLSSDHFCSYNSKYLFFLSRGIILWIELPWPESPANTYTRHTETLDSYFDLIRSHQQCIPWSPPQIAEPKLYNWASVHITHKRRQIKWRSLYTLLMRPFQCFRMSCISICRIFWSWWFSSHDSKYSHPELIIISFQVISKSCICSVMFQITNYS